MQKWQKNQNGSIRIANDKIDQLDQKFDRKFDKLLYMMLGALGMSVITLVTLFFKVVAVRVH